MNSNFDSGFYKNNREKLRRLITGEAPIVLGAHGLVQKSRDEAYPFRQESNFWYLTGVDEPGVVLVINGDEEYLILPKRDEQFARFHGNPDPKKLQDISGIKEILAHEEGWDRLSETLGQAKSVATVKPLPEYIEQIEMYTNPAGRYLADKLQSANKNLNLIDLRPGLSQLRAIKESEEIDVIRKATDATTGLHREIAAGITKYTNEAQIDTDIRTHAAKNQLELAYAPVVAAGSNACVLHYENGQENLAGNPVLIDAGLAYQKYCSDITRTYCTKPSKRYIEIYEAVLAVQEYAISLLKPGILLRDYEKQVNEYMGDQLKQLGLIVAADREAISQYYPHSTSHFLGLDTHDAGNPEKPLESGMVLTVEPGIYVPEESVGIRIEDVVLITENGNEVLSAKLSKSPDSAKIALNA
jgi:Xaa-Pro aminopeptidase